MGVNVRFDRGVVVLSNFGRLMNDPRHFDASGEVGDLIEQGYRGFVLELGAVREAGSTVLGLLTTLTRRIRGVGGEAVLADPTPPMAKYLDEMRMDAYWDVFDEAEEAVAFLADRHGPQDEDG